MRPVYLGDLDAAARAVLAVAAEDRGALASKLVAQAQIADRYRKRTGRAHPEFGVGTLTSAAQNYRKASVAYCDRDYRVALAAVLKAFRHQFV